MWCHKPASTLYYFYVFTQVIHKNFDQDQAKDQAQKPSRELSSAAQVVVDTPANTLWAIPTSYKFNS